MLMFRGQFRVRLDATRLTDSPGWIRLPQTPVRHAAIHITRIRCDAPGQALYELTVPNLVFGIIAGDKFQCMFPAGFILADSSRGQLGPRAVEVRCESNDGIQVPIEAQATTIDGFPLLLSVEISSHQAWCVWCQVNGPLAYFLRAHVDAAITMSFDVLVRAEDVEFLREYVPADGTNFHLNTVAEDVEPNSGNAILDDQR